jgi:hypothetical protein
LAGLPATKEENSLNRGLLGWRCSADSHPSPRDFPAIREFNREFCNSEAFGDGFGARTRCAAAIYRAIPYSGNSEIISGTGIFSPIAGNLSANL